MPELMSKYMDEAELGEDLSTAEMFDKVSVIMDPIIDKINTGAYYGKRKKVVKKAEEIVAKYTEYKEKDDKYRKTRDKIGGIKRLLKDNIAAGKKAELEQSLLDLRKEITDYYIHPVDVYRLGIEMIEYESFVTRQLRTDEYNEIRKDIIGQRDEEISTKKKELNEKMEEIDKWSSNNIKTWASRIGTFFGTYFITDTVLADAEVFDIKLSDAKEVAIGAAFMMLPIVDYYLSKKRSAKTKEYEKKEKEIRKKAKIELVELRRNLSKKYRTIYNLAYEKRRDVYSVCYGSAEDFPENPIEVDDRRRRKMKIDDMPLMATEAEGPKEIRRKAEKYEEEAKQLFSE